VQFWELQKLCDLDLDLDLQSVEVTSACTIYVGLPVPKHVNVASRSTKIWPFEICVMLTFSEV